MDDGRMTATMPMGHRRSTILRVVCAAIVGVASLVIVPPRSVNAHAIHTTLTVITPEAGERGLTLTIRAFADDFSLLWPYSPGDRFRATHRRPPTT